MDSLDTLFRHFTLQAGVFYSGTLCGIHGFSGEEAHGHIHLVRRGPVRIVGIGQPVSIDEPSIVFLPRARSHRLMAHRAVGADVVCGTIQFGRGRNDPITGSLPDLVCVALAELPGVEALLALIFEEGFGNNPGRQAILDRLCEALIVRLLRHCLERGLTRGGTLAGLADPRLSKAIMAIHDNPAENWTLPTMAAAAGMSRARFAARFRDTTGVTPADYLARWRIALAQRLIRNGAQVKDAAYDVGYGSPSAFIRAFIRTMGVSPAAWARAERDAG